MRPVIPRKTLPGAAALRNGQATVLIEALKLHDLGLWAVPCNGKAAIWKDWPTVRRTREQLIEALYA